MFDFSTAYAIIGIDVQDGRQNPMAIAFDESEAFVIVKRLNAEYREKQVHSVHLQVCYTIHSLSQAEQICLQA